MHYTSYVIKKFKKISDNVATLNYVYSRWYKIKFLVELGSIVKI